MLMTPVADTPSHGHGEPGDNSPPCSSLDPLMVKASSGGGVKAGSESGPQTGGRKSPAKLPVSSNSDFVQQRPRRLSPLALDGQKSHTPGGPPEDFTLQRLRLATFGRSRDKLVGQSWLAEVYHGADSVHGSVAVKIFDNRVERSKFVAGVECLAGLRHRNVVPLVGHCRFPMAIVTEWMGGKSLEQRLRDGDLDLLGRLRSMRDAARGLQYLHSKGVAHQGLTPGETTPSATTLAFPALGGLLLGWSSLGT